ncbi:MAG: phosphatase PAP2 family protein [Gemmatimonadota bacterium]
MPEMPGSQSPEPDPLAGESAAPEDRLADRLAGLGVPASQRLASTLHQLGTVDRAVYSAIASVQTPLLDVPVRRLSRAADHSWLWLGIAGTLAVTGGPSGRRAALRGVLAIGVSSTLVNVGVKSLSRRRRPDRASAGVPGVRHVRMPASASFPSGHAASAFAFATAMGREKPWVSLGLRFLAAGVAYSRIHTGVHYPGDTVVGALIGAAAGQAVADTLDRHQAAPALPAAC